MLTSRASVFIPDLLDLLTCDTIIVQLLNQVLVHQVLCLIVALLSPLEYQLGISVKVLQHGMQLRPLDEKELTVERRDDCGRSPGTLKCDRNLSEVVTVV